MSDQKKISMGIVRQGYGLNDNEVEKAIQTLWPNAVFPVELWRRAHEMFWQAFAANQLTYKIESPTLPEINLTAKYFHTHLCALDVLAFFRKLSLNITANDLREGLKYILEEAYEDIDAVFPEERDFLFNALSRLDTIDIFDRYSPDSAFFEEKILSVPVSSYHFVANIFSDTVLVDTVAVIRHFRNYPLRREMKGLTHRLVKSVLDSPAQEAFAIPETTEPPVDPAVGVQSHDGKLVYRVPAALWEGRPDTAVRDAMKADYRLSVIAYVLLYWCGPQKSQASHKTPKGRKTHVGRLLFPEREYADQKSYRNAVDDLLEEADSYTIIKA